MSRLGNKPLPIPQGVKVTAGPEMITVEGPKGKKSIRQNSNIKVEISGNIIKVSRTSEEKVAKQAHGAMWALLANAIKGVSEGFSKVLTVQGVGYKAELSGNTLKFSIGYSKPVLFEVPREISVKVEKDTIITLTCHDKELLGQVCHNIKSIKPADPYKLKGIKYADEVIKQKVGKVGVGGSK
ncbi:MAG: 50S ribosomal protein L6 [Deltaproteobacteria bacterium]|nr:50S ribosomal protein L6 [Deltaproteobacteria bacterium]